MVFHPCWSLTYSRCSNALSFPVESTRPLCQWSSVKSDIAQDRKSLLWSPSINLASRLSKILPVLLFLKFEVKVKALKIKWHGKHLWKWLRQQQLWFWIVWKDSYSFLEYHISFPGERLGGKFIGGFTHFGQQLNRNYMLKILHILTLSFSLLVKCNHG